MNFEEYWCAVCEKYPQFNDGEKTVKLKAKGLRKLCLQSFEKGEEFHADFFIGNFLRGWKK